MKKWFPIFIVSLFFACKKENVNTMGGAWILTDIYYGHSAGCHCWTSVAPSEAEILQFTSLGRYTMTWPNNSCVGYYHVVDDTTIAMSVCGTLTTGQVDRKYSKSNDILIIDYGDDADGVVRYKFKKQSN